MSSDKKKIKFQQCLSEMNNLADRSKQLVARVTELNKTIQFDKDKFKSLQEDFAKGKISQDFATTESNKIKQQIQANIDECKSLQKEINDLNIKITQNLKKMFSL